MSVVSLPFEPDFDLLLDDARERLAAAVGWVDNRNSLDSVLLAENVRIAAVVVALVKDVPREVLLDFWGDLNGVPRVASAPASARSTWTFADTAGYTITAGTEVELVDGDNRARFEVAEDVTVLAGSASTGVGEVTLVAVEAGDAGDGFADDSDVNLVDALAGVDSIELIEATSGGVDAEDDDTYEARIAEELQVPGPSILEADFAIRARSVPGVTRAVAVRGVDPTPAANEQQTVTVDASGGTFTITFDGQTTAAIAFDATAAALQTALDALSNIAPGDVVVTGGPGDAGGTTPYTVEFTGQYRHTNVAAMTTGAGSLTGGAGTAVVATTVAGAAPLTGQEGMVAVAVVDDDGAAVASPVKDAVEELLEDADHRVVNVEVHVIDPAFNLITVVFAAKAAAGYEPADVEAAAEAHLAEYLAPANWGATTSSLPDWENKTVVRYLEVAAELNAVEGLDYVESLTINGAAADYTMTGIAALPDPASTVSGTVTAL